MVDVANTAGPNTATKPAPSTNTAPNVTGTGAAKKDYTEYENDPAKRNMAQQASGQTSQTVKSTGQKDDDANIASPDVFLNDYHRDHGQRVRIVQVWADGAKRGYVITDETSGNSRKIGYFELSEGMNKAEAESLIGKAYDNTAVVL